ncbi:hypothetical protein [Streptomyces sp. NEAU-NA10]|uniref:hypothetical protein n=1 Tax=Streptomyces sp. NEAU-NA10 TaxID=3416050 RepID=UPI003CC5DAC9
MTVGVATVRRRPADAAGRPYGPVPAQGTGRDRRERQSRVKGAAAAYGSRQRRSRPASQEVSSKHRCPQEPHLQELTMADLAFVVTTVAVFALVVLVAKGVTKP